MTKMAQEGEKNQLFTVTALLHVGHDVLGLEVAALGLLAVPQPVPRRRAALLHVLLVQGLQVPRLQPLDQVFPVLGLAVPDHVGILGPDGEVQWGTIRAKK